MCVRYLWCRALSRAELPAGCEVSTGVRALHDEFWMCSNAACRKIYWQAGYLAPSCHNTLLWALCSVRPYWCLLHQGYQRLTRLCAVLVTGLAVWQCH